MLLARRMHEDRRAERLARLQDELELHLRLSDVEKEIVAESWRAGVDAMPVSARPVSLTWPLQDTLLLRVLFVARLAAHIDTLDDLWTEHKLDSRDQLNTFAPAEYPPEEGEEDFPSSAADAEDREELSASAAIDAANMLRDPKQSAVIDAKLKAQPSALYTETARQRALSEMEAEVWEVLGLQPPRSEYDEPAIHAPAEEELDAQTTAQVDRLADEAASDTEQPVDTDAIPMDELDASTMVRDVPAAMSILSEIMTLSPPVRDTYVRALDMPLETHHAACRDLLTAMGVPILTATIPFEAEGLASALAIAGYVDYVGTEDSDAVVYGVSRMASQHLGQDWTGPDLT